jgi:hypothetical protein
MVADELRRQADQFIDLDLGRSSLASRRRAQPAGRRPRATRTTSRPKILTPRRAPDEPWSGSGGSAYAAVRRRNTSRRR